MAEEKPRLEIEPPRLTMADIIEGLRKAAVDAIDAFNRGLTWLNEHEEEIREFAERVESHGDKDSAWRYVFDHIPPWNAIGIMIFLEVESRSGQVKSAEVV